MLSRKHASITLKWILSIIAIWAVFTLTTPIHEGSHVLVAKITDVPVNSVEWFAGKVIYGEARTTGRTLTDYAGGLVTGSLLLIIIVWKREWFRQTPYYWFGGLFASGLAFWEICSGFLEGAWHNKYVTDSQGVGGVTTLILLLSFIIGVISYWAYVYKPKGMTNINAASLSFLSWLLLLIFHAFRLFIFF